ncbi:integrase catalytic domain-containing protein [Trichonephila clavipes]|nr:integrase catalytic domain-containing protein [Trichonephila clavipes]
MYLLKAVTVPRYIAINETSELHIFVDASKSSYGACVFVRTVVENDVKVTLLRSKARVAPLKSLTIPRLELMSCCIGARLANSIIRALNLPGIKVIYWSDSEVALWWIREQENWSVFVANLMLDSKWWEGPRRLKNNREQWPANEINCEPKDVILEKRKSELVNVNISEELVPWVHVEERKLSELSSDDIENSERVLIREVVMKSVPCRRYSSNSPMSEPVSLHADRVKDANAFDITGIDLAGPLFTRDGGKVWIVLYTCAIYRAIHLELVSSLSTECFMLSLRRFIARRTRPETIYTDNGTNFVGTNSELKNLDWDKIMQETDIKPIKWKFNPPTAAWWRGWGERLVRVIKELLKRTLGKAILTYAELLTVLCDCEAVVNSRPLTYVSEDPKDLIPLTPSLFLNGKSSYDTIDLDLSEFSKFQKRIKYRRKLIHDFRSRFRKKYLGQLRQKRQGKPGHDFKVGDVVMIEEPSKKRVYWPLGKVISLLPGRDGKVRTLQLKCKNSELIRPIQRVYPLEVPFINNEIVKIDGVPTSSVNEDKLTRNAVIKINSLDQFSLFCIYGTRHNTVSERSSSDYKTLLQEMCTNFNCSEEVSGIDENNGRFRFAMSVKDQDDTILELEQASSLGVKSSIGAKEINLTSIKEVAVTSQGFQYILVNLLLSIPSVNVTVGCGIMTAFIYEVFFFLKVERIGSVTSIDGK